MDDLRVPTPLDLGMRCYHSCLLCLRDTDVLRLRLMMSRPRSARGKKEVGMIGQAGWISSVINLVNTSAHTDPSYESLLKFVQSLALESLLCRLPSPAWECFSASLSSSGQV